MKAVRFKKYGPPEVLKVIEVEKPKPKDNEVLIKIVASTVMSAECELRRADFKFPFNIMIRLVFGIFRPRKGASGQELSGVVEQIGAKVTEFKVGDEVFGITGFKMAAHAEYICLPSSYPLAIKSNEISFNEATAISVGGANALHFLRLANIKVGEKILIHGATGGIGTFAVQIAKYFGGEVTAVCNERDSELVKSLGATNVIDYTKEDFTKNSEIYDVIFDTIGRSHYFNGISALKKGGRYLLADPSTKELFTASKAAKKIGKTAILNMADTKIEDLEFLQNLMLSGDLKVIIDSIYPLNNIVEAHRYVEKRTKVGHVVLEIG